MSDAKKEDKEESKKVEVQSVEEDDEFEEFPLQDWQAKENADEEEVDAFVFFVYGEQRERCIDLTRII
ncbi:unnamed protein product [Toxocara canis]|uniref:Phosducin domain-containing protein n=1 Tax=Toxocara canis TaxID=6265 RepID=A0A183UHC8_TOXCA|nr:unnamed protein product [Toxocara canis]